MLLYLPTSLGAFVCQWDQAKLEISSMGDVKNMGYPIVICWSNISTRYEVYKTREIYCNWLIKYSLYRYVYKINEVLTRHVALLACDGNTMITDQMCTETNSDTTSNTNISNLSGHACQHSVRSRDSNHGNKLSKDAMICSISFIQTHMIRQVNQSVVGFKQNVMMYITLQVQK